jgi:DNA-directed RNA polymerase specialized sigma subunit
MSKLEPNERLLIRLRFEEGLTLDQVAKMLGLGNAQRVDREINESLSKLRKLI